MTAKANLAIVTTLMAVLASSPSFSAEMTPLQDFLKKEFDKSATASKEIFHVSTHDKQALMGVAPNAEESQFVFYYGKNSAGTLEKACATVPQDSLDGSMEIGTCFAASGVITSVTILGSNDSGNAKKVSEPNFLKQFAGKKFGDSFLVGKDLIAVNDAMNASKAVAEAVRKSAFAFKTYVVGKKPAASKQ